MVTNGYEGGAGVSATKAGTRLAGAGLVAAVVVLVAWLGFLVLLVVKVDASEVAWARMLVVLGSVEAVAFAAAGALFGTTVQRQRLEDERARADAAESRAEENLSAAINGHKLAAAIRVTRAGGGREQLSADGADPLLELADQLFPEG